MRKFVCGNLVIVVALAGCNRPAASTKGTKLSDGCAIASLLAIKAIQGDPFVPEANSGLVSRSTQEKIDAADVAAVSPEERHVAGALNVVYHAQLFQNTRTNRLQLMQKLARHGRETAGMKAEREEMAREVSDFEMVLNGCLRDFDESLRARSLAVPKSCEVLPQTEDTLEAAWQQVEGKLSSEADARRREHQKVVEAEAYRQKRLTDLSLCDKNDRYLEHEGNFHGLDKAGQQRLHRACEDVRNGKRHDLGDEFE